MEPQRPRGITPDTLGRVVQWNRSWMPWFTHQPEIRSFAEDTAGMSGLSARYRGIHAIPVDQIVGSVGRAHELRPNFMPILRPFGDHRFQAIRERMERGESLPPVDLYKLHDRYYVVDGNHRVAAARKVGLAALDAVVIEYQLGWVAA